jgi:hypothetical protein
VHSAEACLLLVITEVLSLFSIFHSMSYEMSSGEGAQCPSMAGTIFFDDSQLSIADDWTDEPDVKSSDPKATSGGAKAKKAHKAKGSNSSSQSSVDSASVSAIATDTRAGLGYKPLKSGDTSSSSSKGADNTILADRIAKSKKRKEIVRRLEGEQDGGGVKRSGRDGGTDAGDDDYSDDDEIHGVVERKVLSKHSAKPVVSKNSTAAKTANQRPIVTEKAIDKADGPTKKQKLSNQNNANDEISGSSGASASTTDPNSVGTARAVGSFGATVEGSIGPDGQKRKRKKTRSKQKNIRRDNRQDTQKPEYLRVGSAEYRGRPLTDATKAVIGIAPKSNS